MEKELGLFVIWHNARYKEKEILNEIKLNFNILEVYEIEWNKKTFKTNLERFYCEKIRKKIKETGTGSFLLVTFYDENPSYAYEKTLKGYELVNKKVLNVKKKLRDMTGGGYKLHATNDIKEADKNLVFLIGKNCDEYKRYSQNKVFNGEYIKYKHEPIGYDGWNDISEVFKVLNASCEYVVLRGFDEQGGDIDLLVDDFMKVKYLLNAEKVHRQSYRMQVKTKVGDCEMLFDLSYTGDNYYCEKWQEDILKNRITDKNGYYTPDSVNLFYTLVYHCLFHKKNLSKKYDILLEKLFKQISDLSLEDYENPYDLYIILLNNYMNKNDYYPIKPLDKKVKYNEYNIEKMFWMSRLSENYSIQNINSINLNKRPASGYKYFFKANYNGRKVFIKCGDGNFDAKKEYKVYEYLKNQHCNYIPEPVMYRNLENNKIFLCLEYIEGDLLSEEIIKSASKEKINKICESLFEIADVLYKNKFVHKDINKNNFIVKYDGTVILVDFQHLTGAYFKESPQNIKCPRKLRGTNKFLRPYNYVWDDMYSIYKIFKMLIIPNMVFPWGGGILENKLNELKSKIGKRRYYFCDNKFPITVYLSNPIFIIYKVINVILKPFRKFLK